MSLEDLERTGVARPRDLRGKHEIRSTVNKPAFLACAAGAISAGFLMYVGNGRFATWVGALLFLGALIGATIVLLKATAPYGQDLPGRLNCIKSREV